jgi:hypothetical protein
MGPDVPSLKASVGPGMELITVPTMEFGRTESMDRCLLGGDVADRRALIVDLTRLTVTGYDLLAKLLSARTELEPQGVCMALICGSHDRRVFELGGLDRMFLLASTLVEAYQGLGALDLVREA